MKETMLYERRQMTPPENEQNLVPEIKKSPISSILKGAKPN